LTGTILKRRCAVYTRKSTDEGLEMAFNSLDAQREACEAYVASQRGEGWVLVADRYDDGGHSGGTLERPALKRLLADIQAGKVDCVVVYKIDRLTRALMDFSKLVDLFDKHGVTFVSVTQSFNTTSSMGRLTLNILLSFAQFERELGSERVRDKIATSKRRGLWTGGVVPLGYKAVNRQLLIDPAEAAIAAVSSSASSCGGRSPRCCANWTAMASAIARGGPSTRWSCTRSSGTRPTVA
jgi:DNA invertase Pin-like site-specific DNA recombinase